MPCSFNVVLLTEMEYRQTAGADLTERDSRYGQ